MLHVNRQVPSTPPPRLRRIKPAKRTAISISSSSTFVVVATNAGSASATFDFDGSGELFVDEVSLMSLSAASISSIDPEGTHQLQMAATALMSINVEPEFLLADYRAIKRRSPVMPEVTTLNNRGEPL